MQIAPYSVLMVAGIGLSFLFWRQQAPRLKGLGVIYFSALAGAFFGAKLVYVAAEGWLHWNDPQHWMYLATGKTILGALLGGYAAVEVAKRATGFRQATGDTFATIAPLSIVLGRIGCLLHGCCLGSKCAPAWYSLRDQAGVTRWPAVPAEIIFNLIAVITLWSLRRRNLLIGQQFHVYLMGYGAFRFVHEFVRDTPTILGPLTGYQFAAAAVFLLGAVRFYQRQKAFALMPLPGGSSVIAPNA